jgi:phage anti-repressor protein
MLKFKKKELIQRLGMSEEDANKVMLAQKKFPTLLATENEKGFIIDARTIWEELNKPHGQFNKWIDRKLISKNYIENSDYIRMDKIVQGDSNGYGNAKSKEYTLTLNCAKKIAMRENTNEGDLICDYFILLEEAIKNMDKWYEARHPEKTGYKNMCAMLERQYMDSHDGKKPDFHIYTNNADMINLCMFGKKSKAMKQILDVEYEDLLRDSLTTEANKAISEVQLLNENLVLSNVDFQTRKQIITNTCNSKYMDIRVKIVSEFHKELMNVGDK